MPHLKLELSYQPSTQSLFERMLSLDHPTLLLSNKDGLSYRQNRWDIISANPKTIIAHDERDSTAHLTGDVLKTQLNQQICEALNSNCSLNEDNNLPFISGAIGLMSYPAGERFLEISNGMPDQDIAGTPQNWPKFLVGIYQWALITDHLSKKRWLVGDPKLDTQEWLETVQLFEAFLLNARNEKQCDQITSTTALTESHFELTSEWKQSLSKAQYAQAFSQIKEYILSGECYQTNLTQQFSATYTGSPWIAAQRAWNASAAPFACYISNNESTIASCSPECFIQIEGGRAITRPIKGTKPRGTTLQDDSNNAKALHQSTKDKAENLMIVDLMRNDLGKFCKTGSVNTPNLFEVESFSNVHHLVSTISGEIEPNNPEKSLELFLGCLPGGSITGAPKKRAMEIIRELEPHNRSIYCGSMFYLTPNGNLNSNIMIRSLLFEQDQANSNSGKVYCWGGGGIVADSSVETEYAEAQIKVQNILNTISA